MKAIQQQGYGDPREVLHLVDVDVPQCTKDQVLVRVRASSANPYDWHLICGEPLLSRESRSVTRSTVSPMARSLSSSQPRQVASPANRRT